ncbi:sperm-associated antigen 17 [Hippocampus comes]|uniref:sperm-associated antigen 17 n=1 Tax=Hippocampus comes TaxID=109280 RepID=UPI00094E3472|nr:PREDICTED: sperm-associated antigen 17-like [Hippocampus comes]
MPPKGAKKGAAAKKTAAAQGPDVQTWESGLANAQFDEDNWQACVCVLVGRSPDDEDLIRLVARAVQQPQRKLFTSLAWEDTEAKIREYGNPKAKKRDAFPQYYEVTAPARELLEAHEEIPAELMAQIIKFMLLQVKESDQRRRKTEQVRAAAPVAKGKAGAKGKDKKAKDEPPPKPKTKLKRRDDVEPPKYINDEPNDGPQHYILLMGFHQPQLVGTLDGAGVHVANVIRLSATHPPCEEDHEQDEENPEPNADEIAAKEARAAQAKVLDHFWGALRQVLDNGGANSRLHNVAQLEYAVPDSLMPFDRQDFDSVMAVATQMFDDVANLIYDCLDWRRQHQHYLDSANFIRVPSVVSGQDAPPPAETGATVSPRSKKPGRPPAPKKPPSSLTTDVDMNHYSSLMEHVPAEACSVPLILHCMLEQVVLSSEQPPPSQAPDDSDPETAPGLDHHVVGQMLQNVLPEVEPGDEKRDLLDSLLTTVQRQEDKEMLKEQFQVEVSPRTPEQPVIIRHHDERALRLIGITGTQGLDPAQEEAAMMKQSPAWRLINSVAQRRSNSSCWRAIKQQLQRQCTDDEVSWPQVERFLHQSVFESMQLTGLDEDGVLGKDCRPLGMVHHAKKPPVNPWDNPLSFAKQKLRNQRKKSSMFLQDDSTDSTEISERLVVQLDLNDIQSCRLRSLKDWHYVEHHEAAVFPQVLQSAAQQYRCLDTLRGSHNNVLYIFCHNPMSSNRLCKEFWDVAIHTDVKFRTYLEHVADTIRDWIEKEELKKQELENTQISPAQESENCTEEDEESQVAYITKNSLKAARLEEERLKEEESKKGKKPAKAAGGKKQKPAKDAKSADAKKSDKSANTGKSKTTTNSSTVAASDQSLSIKTEDKEEAGSGFTGFHMDGMLVHLSGSLQYLFPAAGGDVTVETVSYVEGSRMLKVAVKQDGHHFYTHISPTYLEHVADTIRDWIEKEELKKQELENTQISPAQESENCTEEDEESQVAYITKNSLKAARLEEERLKEEESKKGKKPAKAAGGKKQKPAKDAKSADAKKSDKSANTGKSKTTTNSSTVAASDQSLSIKTEDKEEAGSGFTGFHMDGMLVHLSGSLQYLFPAAGGDVTVETVSYVEGSRMLKVAVKQDGHHFYTHISHVVHAARNDVKEHPVKTTVETRRGFSALLDNGVRLSYSFERPPEKSKAPQESLKETEKGQQETTVADLTDIPNNDGTPAEVQVQPCEIQPEVCPSPFNSLSLSIPSGLLVQFIREDEDLSMLVRLSFHAAGCQGPCLAKEASRTITSQGTVIRYMKDSSSEVLFADGTVSSSLDSGPVWVQEIEEVEAPDGKGPTLN